MCPVRLWPTKSGQSESEQAAVIALQRVCGSSIVLRFTPVMILYNALISSFENVASNRILGSSLPV
jgi:hypothetical protein